MVRLFACLVTLVATVGVCWGKRYDDYALYVVRPEAESHLKYLQTLEDNKFMDVIFLRTPNLLDNLPLLVNRDDQDQFIERTHHFSIKTKLVFQNIQKEFDSQSSTNARQENSSIWEYYHTLNEIDSWLHKMAQEYSSLTLLKSIGKSVENRSIYSFCIKAKGENKYKVIVVAGIHGDEWISTAVVMYLIDQLLTSNFDLLVELKSLYTWYFIPVLNPDGYFFSHEHDRLWRKNRKREGPKIVGVDLNRNFKFSVASHDASDDPNHKNYRGPSEFSEPETRALRDFVSQKQKKLMFYLAFHGFGQKIIIPYTAERQFDFMQKYIKQASEKIFDYSGRKYAYGTTSQMLGKKISGDSVTWVREAYHVPYTYAIMPRDDGVYGPALPTSQLLPACRDVMVGVVELLKASPVERLASERNNRAVTVTTSPMPLILLLIMLPTAYLINCS